MSSTATQYIHRESFIHKLNPLSKFIALFLIALILIVRSIWLNNLVVLCILIAAQFASKISFRQTAKLLWSMRFFFYVTFLVHLLFSSEAEKFSLWIIKPSLAGAERGIFYGTRMYLLLWSSVLLGWTTEPVALAESIKKIVFPLRLVGISQDDFAMSLVLAMRFIPTIYDDIRWLIYAQRSRGFFIEKRFWRRVKGLLPLLIPLFSTVIRRAEKLAIALEIHGYAISDRRTNLNEHKWTWMDVSLVLLLSIVFLGAVFI